MAEVHLGRDTRLGRSVAIKLLRTDLARDPTFQARFRREAQSAAALNHPAIVSVYDTGEEPVVEAGGAVVNLPYIVMEHVAGRTLRDLLAEHHHLDVDFALEITAGVLSALEYSHRIGIVHRDIKPANVMLTPTGDVKVMDFGIARAMADASSTMTQTQAVIGTAQYLSPEQARGEQVDTRSDLYSAGCLLFELLTGRPPFVADSPVAVAYQHVREPAPPPSQFIPGIPESVDRITLHSLAKGREERYQSAAEFRADVEAARGGRQVMASVPAAATTQYVPAPDTGATRALPPAAAAAGGLLGQTAAGGYPPAYDDPENYRRRDRQPPPSRRGPIIAGIAIVVIAALAGFFLIRLLGGGGSSGASSNLTFPDVRGQALPVALDTLTKAGFTTKPTQVDRASSTVDDGKVIDTDPAAGQSVAKTVQITLVVSSGEDAIEVPDLKGMTQEEAVKKLGDMGLSLGGVETEEDVSVKAGEVFKSDPAAGEQVKPNDKVKIFLASDTVTVPDVRGQLLSDAKDELATHELSAKTSKVESDKPVGTVLSQDISAGTKAPRGSVVRLTVAMAPTSTPTPSITTSTPVTTPTTPVVSPTTP